MTPSEVGAEVSATMARTSHAVSTEIKAALTESGATARKEMEGAGKRHTGGDLKFSGTLLARLPTPNRRSSVVTVELHEVESIQRSLAIGDILTRSDSERLLETCGRLLAERVRIERNPPRARTGVG